jgi:cytochrome P450
MQSFCHHVLHDPAIHARLENELDNAAASGHLSAFPLWNETQALPYFQACLKEAMRLRPAVGLNITRLVPPQGAEIGGRRLPGGTRVAVNAWVLHRDEGIFGAQPKSYRPERWLERDARGMERYMFQFGGGSHLCEFLIFWESNVEWCGLILFGVTGIGKNLALLEMNKTLPLLFRDYELELLRPQEDLKYRSTFFVVQHGLDVKISKRNGVVWEQQRCSSRFS